MFRTLLTVGVGVDLVRMDGYSINRPAGFLFDKTSLQAVTVLMLGDDDVEWRSITMTLFDEDSNPHLVGGLPVPPPPLMDADRLLTTYRL